MMLHNGNPSRVGRNILPAGDFCCVRMRYFGQLRVKSDADRLITQADCNKDWTCNWTEKMNAAALTVSADLL